MSKCIYENLPADEVKRLRKESREKFELIYEKTLEVLKLDKSSVPCSDGFQQCWDDLIDIWRSNALKMDCVVMNSVMHHIAWGRYPDTQISGPLQELLLLVEQAVLAEGYAFEVWQESGVLRRELNFIREMVAPRSKSACCGSRWFGRYVYSYTFSQVCLKSRILNSEFEGVSWDDIHMFVTAPQARENVVVFEGAIKRLLPDAKTWTRVQWADENWILQEIHRVHGIDYTLDYPAFDALIDVFDLCLNGRSYDRNLLLLNAFPETMMACLWPKNTQLELERFFLRVSRRTRKQMKINPNTYAAFRTSVLMGSWVWNYYFGGSVTYSNKVKTEQFNVLLGI